MDYEGFLLEFIKDAGLVFFGLFMARLYDWIKESRRKDRVAKKLVSELKVILDAIHEKEKYIAGEDFPLITDTYDSLRYEIPSMNWKEGVLTLIHRTYVNIKELNKYRVESQYGYRKSSNQSSYYYNHEGLTIVKQQIESLIEKLDNN